MAQRVSSRVWQGGQTQPVSPRWPGRPSCSSQRPHRPTCRSPHSDGRRSSTVYAARVPHVLAGQSRLTLVLDGVGLDEAESRRAAAELAPAITLALSPYGEHLAPIAAAARRAGHEILVSIPMEPEGSPVTDEGDRQLRPDAAPNENALNLDWALSRVAGIVGATGAEAGRTARMSPTPPTCSGR